MTDRDPILDPMTEDEANIVLRNFAREGLAQVEKPAEFNVWKAMCERLKVGWTLDNGDLAKLAARLTVIVNHQQRQIEALEQRLDDFEKPGKTLV